jgi:hypothetical protein
MDQILALMEFPRLLREPNGVDQSQLNKKIKRLASLTTLLKLTSLFLVLVPTKNLIKL